MESNIDKATVLTQSLNSYHADSLNNDSVHDEVNHENISDKMPSSMSADVDCSAARSNSNNGEASFFKQLPANDKMNNNNNINKFDNEENELKSNDGMESKADLYSFIRECEEIGWKEIYHNIALRGLIAKEININENVINTSSTTKIKQGTEYKGLNQFKSSLTSILGSSHSNGKLSNIPMEIEENEVDSEIFDEYPSQTAFSRADTSNSSIKQLPIRILDRFSLYYPDGTLAPFDAIATAQSLSNGFCSLSAYGTIVEPSRLSDTNNQLLLSNPPASGHILGNIGFDPSESILYNSKLKASIISRQQMKAAIQIILTCSIVNKIAKSHSISETNEETNGVSNEDDIIDEQNENQNEYRKRSREEYEDDSHATISEHIGPPLHYISARLEALIAMKELRDLPNIANSTIASQVHQTIENLTKHEDPLIKDASKAALIYLESNKKSTSGKSTAADNVIKQKLAKIHDVLTKYNQIDISAFREPKIAPLIIPDFSIEAEAKRHRGNISQSNDTSSISDIASSSPPVGSSSNTPEPGKVIQEYNYDGENVLPKKGRYAAHFGMLADFVNDASDGEHSLKGWSMEVLERVKQNSKFQTMTEVRFLSPDSQLYETRADVVKSFGLVLPRGFVKYNKHQEKGFWKKLMLETIAEKKTTENDTTDKQIAESDAIVNEPEVVKIEPIPSVPVITDPLSQIQDLYDGNINLTPDISNQKLRLKERSLLFTRLSSAFSANASYKNSIIESNKESDQKMQTQSIEEKSSKIERIRRYLQKIPIKTTSFANNDDQIEKRLIERYPALQNVFSSKDSSNEMDCSDDEKINQTNQNRKKIRVHLSKIERWGLTIENRDVILWLFTPNAAYKIICLKEKTCPSSLYRTTFLPTWLKYSACHCTYDVLFAIDSETPSKYDDILSSIIQMAIPCPGQSKDLHYPTSDIVMSTSIFLNPDEAITLDAIRSFAKQKSWFVSKNIDKLNRLHLLQVSRFLHMVIMSHANLPLSSTAKEFLENLVSHGDAVHEIMKYDIQSRNQQNDPMNLYLDISDEEKLLHISQLTSVHDRKVDLGKITTEDLDLPLIDKWKAKGFKTSRPLNQERHLPRPFNIYMDLNLVEIEMLFPNKNPYSLVKKVLIDHYIEPSSSSSSISSQDNSLEYAKESHKQVEGPLISYSDSVNQIEASERFARELEVWDITVRLWPILGFDKEMEIQLADFHLFRKCLGQSNLGELHLNFLRNLLDPRSNEVSSSHDEEKEELSQFILGLNKFAATPINTHCRGIVKPPGTYYAYDYDHLWPPPYWLMNELTYPEIVRRFIIQHLRIHPESSFHLKDKRSKEEKEKIFHELVDYKPDMLGICGNVLIGLLEDPLAPPFSRPVNPILDNVPDYFTQIKRPMDLTTIQNRLASGHYEESRVPPNTYVIDEAKLLKKEGRSNDRRRAPNLAEMGLEGNSWNGKDRNDDLGNEQNDNEEYDDEDDEDDENDYENNMEEEGVSKSVNARMTLTRRFMVREYYTMRIESSLGMGIQYDISSALARNQARSIAAKKVKKGPFRHVSILAPFVELVQNLDNMYAANDCLGAGYEGFCTDVRQVFGNGRTFNKSSTSLYRSSTRLEEYFFYIYRHCIIPRDPRNKQPFSLPDIFYNAQHPIIESTTNNNKTTDKDNIETTFEAKTAAIHHPETLSKLDNEFNDMLLVDDHQLAEISKQEHVLHQSLSSPQESAAILNGNGLPCLADVAIKLQECIDYSLLPISYKVSIVHFLAQRLMDLPGVQESILANNESYQNTKKKAKELKLKLDVEIASLTSLSSSLNEDNHDLNSKLVDNPSLKIKHDELKVLQNQMKEVRPTPELLGYDKMYNRYWFFDDILEKTCWVFVEDVSTGMWGIYDNPNDIKSLMDGLDKRGNRESNLYRRLKRSSKEMEDQMNKEINESMKSINDLEISLKQYQEAERNARAFKTKYEEESSRIANLPPPIKPAVQCKWLEAKAENGRSYYYHADTRQTTWDKPVELEIATKRAEEDYQRMLVPPKNEYTQPYEISVRAMNESKKKLDQTRKTAQLNDRLLISLLRFGVLDTDEARMKEINEGLAKKAGKEAFNKRVCLAIAQLLLTEELSPLKTVANAERSQWIEKTTQICRHLNFPEQYEVIIAELKEAIGNLFIYFKTNGNNNEKINLLSRHHWQFTRSLQNCKNLPQVSLMIHHLRHLLSIEDTQVNIQSEKNLLDKLLSNIKTKAVS